MRIESDIVVVGSAFGGSLTAAILQKAGFSVVLLERDQHPRFVIGESSTPAANLLLKQLADKHGLEYLKPLCKYGSWRQELPNIRRGLKRGFSYFAHESGTEFQPRLDHANELLVAASVSDEVGDTQWYRADVDNYLCEQAVGLGVRLIERAEVTRSQYEESQAVVDFEVHGEPFSLEARVVVDATGGRLVTSDSRSADALDQSNRETFLTKTRSIFGHFDGLPKWAELIDSVSGHPFECDNSAMHHLLDDRWMWWIRFDDGTTSVGLVINESNSSSDQSTPVQSPHTEWNATLARQPSLERAFRQATNITGLIATNRLQRGTRGLEYKPAKENEQARLVRLPNSIGFVDPLHSTGIAHTLSGVLRVTDLLIENSDDDSCRIDCIRKYHADVMHELVWIDDLVSGCYSHLHEFRKFAAFSMCYFAAATTFERRFLEGEDSTGFLCCNDQLLRANVRALTKRDPSESAKHFENACQAAIAPFNHVGLFSPEITNMYAYTALLE